MSVSNVYKVSGINAAQLYDRHGNLLYRMVVFLPRRHDHAQASAPFTLVVNPMRVTVEKLIRFRRYARRMARKQGLR